MQFVCCMQQPTKGKRQKEWANLDQVSRLRSADKLFLMTLPTRLVRNHPQKFWRSRDWASANRCYVYVVTAVCAICFPQPTGEMKSSWQLTSASHHAFFQPRDEGAGTALEVDLVEVGMLAAQEPLETVSPTALSGEVLASLLPCSWPFSPPLQWTSRWTWSSSWAEEWRDRRGWDRLGVGLQSFYTAPSKKPWPCWGRRADWLALGSWAFWGGGRADDCPPSPVPPEGTSSNQTWSSGLLWSRVSQPQVTDQTGCSPTWTHTV